MVRSSPRVGSLEVKEMSGNKIESREQLIKALADEFDACAGEYTIPDKPRSRLQKYRLTEKGRQMLAVGSSSIGKR